MQKTIYILSILLCLLSCKKKEMIHVSAVNPANGEMYAGLRFTITEEKTGAFNEEFTKVYDGNLSESGEALFELKLHKNRSYKLNMQKPENNCYMDPPDITFDVLSESFDFKFELAPCAFIKRKIVNVNCVDANDLMKLYTQHSIPNYLNFSNSEWIFHGCTGFQADNYSSVPMGEFVHKWEVTRNSITETFYDTVYLNPGEYKTFEINY